MNASKRFLLCKLLPSLCYPYAVEYKEVLLTTLSTSYTDYQRFLLCKLLPFLGPHSQLQQILFVLFRKKKILKSRGNISTLGKNSKLLGKFSILWKILNFRENPQPKRKFSSLEKIQNLVENSQLKRKFSTQERIFNLRENSQLKKKLSNQQKIFKLIENSHFKRKFSTLKKILNIEKYW